jgi:hypothetical protein
MKPLPRKLSNRIQRAGFLKQVRGSRNNLEPALRFVRQLTHGGVIEGKHHSVIATDNE